MSGSGASGGGGGGCGGGTGGATAAEPTIADPAVALPAVSTGVSWPRVRKNARRGAAGGEHDRADDQRQLRPRLHGRAFLRDHLGHVDVAGPLRLLAAGGLADALGGPGRRALALRLDEAGRRLRARRVRGCGHARGAHRLAAIGERRIARDLADRRRRARRSSASARCDPSRAPCRSHRRARAVRRSDRASPSAIVGGGSVRCMRQHAHEVVGLERHAAGDQLEQDAAHRVDVDAVIDRARRAPARATCTRACRTSCRSWSACGRPRRSTSVELGDAEVEQLHEVGLAEESTR